MKRAETVEVGRPLRLVTRDVPAPPARGARIRTAFAGVCHSDLHQLADKSLPCTFHKLGEISVSDIWFALCSNSDVPCHGRVPVNLNMDHPNSWKIRSCIQITPPISAILINMIYFQIWLK